MGCVCNGVIGVPCGAHACIRRYPQSSFLDELTGLLNRYSKENGSDTPDFALAIFLKKALEAFDGAVKLRTAFYDRPDKANR